MTRQSTRFNSPEYLRAWQLQGQWPAIHNAMTDFALANMRGSFLLDLGCSYGLLGARIAMEAGGLACAGIDADAKVVEAAVEAGVPMRFHVLSVNKDTLPDLEKILTVSRPKTMIARRVLPELWGYDLEGGRAFVELLAASGLREIFLEGRVASERATNPLRSIDDEVTLLSPRYREVTRSKALSYLVLR